MISGKTLPRRTFLRGLGTTIALPFLEAMTPALTSSRIPGKTPVRMAFVYVPNGIDTRHWNPDYEGSLRELPRILKPLEPFKNDVLLLGNLTHNTGRALLDGPGDHSRCCASYLTGVQPRKTRVDIRSGVSCDQIVAQHTGRQTRFPSLEIGIEGGCPGGCDPGYSRAYTTSLAWGSPTQPLPPILDPRALFNRLFRHSGGSHGRVIRDRRSVLDLVRDDTRRLQSRLAPCDRRRIEQYCSSIREIEIQIDQVVSRSEPMGWDLEKLDSVPLDFAAQFKLMTDMITLAFQGDLTRVVTLLVAPEGSVRPYPEIDIAEGHHPLTHHQNDPALMEKVARINGYHLKQFAGWIERLQSIPEGESTLLDHSMIVYGAGLSDGNRHIHDDLPTLIAGRGGYSITPGRRIVYRRETPMTNLWLALMDRMEVRVEHFGDSTGRLKGLELG